MSLALAMLRLEVAGLTFMFMFTEPGWRLTGLENNTFQWQKSVFKNPRSHLPKKKIRPKNQFDIFYCYFEEEAQNGVKLLVGGGSQVSGVRDNATVAR